MLRNYLIVAWRNLVRHKVYSLINIAGLAIAIACCLLILLFVRHEWTYDQCHQNADRIYRLYEVCDGGRSSVMDGALGPAMVEDYPGVIAATRTYPSGPIEVVYEDHLFQEELLFADSNLFEVFSFPAVEGDPGTALRSGNSVIIDREVAAKLFGERDGLGETITFVFRNISDLDNRWIEERYEFPVGAVVEVPSNSTLKFGLVLPWQFLKRRDPEPICLTYVLLDRGVAPTAIEAQLPQLVDKLWPRLKFKEWGHTQVRLVLQPLLSLHYLATDYHPGNPRYPYILMSIGLAILGIACINFVNLAIGRGATRAREIGIRKVVGAKRRQLVGQFLGETVLLSFLALLLGLVLAELFLPSFDNMVQCRLQFDYANPSTLLGTLGLTLLVGLLAGAYPALVLSRFQPVEVLRKKLRVGGRNRFSRGLIALQFALSVFFLVSATAMTRQLDYLKTKDLGFDGDQVVFCRMSGSQLQALHQQELMKYSQIEGVAGSFPGPGFTDGGIWQWPLADRTIDYRPYWISANFLETLGIELVAGRGFRPTDTREVVLINEALARELGWDDPLGRQLTGINEGPLGENKAQSADPVVIGVVRDSHFYSLHQKIYPEVFQLQADQGSFMYVRLNRNGIAAGMEILRKTWEKFSPHQRFEVGFLDEHFANLYREEERWGRIISVASGLAILVACMGLFGMVVLVGSQRTKEIGIRKVLGASVPSIVALLSKEFTYLVLIANLIAWPLAWYAMHRWLDNFAYRIELGPGVFVLGGVLVLLIAWLTVSWQAIRAARANPVEALRYE